MTAWTNGVDDVDERGRTFVPSTSASSLSPLLLLLLPFSSPSSLNALVWFWLIDETLSANLVYQSDYEIGSTTLSGEANEDHDLMNGDAMVMIKVLRLGKEAREIQKA